MPPEPERIFPLGDAALTIEFGRVISEELNDRAIALAAAVTRTAFPGFIEAVAAYASTTVFYDPLIVRRASPNHTTAFSAVKETVEKLHAELPPHKITSAREIEIALRFDDDSAPDLGDVARHAGLARNEVIEIFTARTYRVYMLGFLPGFAYMGEVDERIAAPRRSTPRTKLARGSVGIAGRQTGIYPLESPGGWQIVGRTDVTMFDPSADPPVLLKAGDQVRFVAT